MGDGWDTSFRSPSPDLDDANIPANVNLNSAADLMRELDLSWVDDRANFVETPFTMAAERAHLQKVRGIETSTGRTHIEPAIDKTKLPKEPTPPAQASKGHGPANQWGRRSTWNSYQSKNIVSAPPRQANIWKNSQRPVVTETPVRKSAWTDNHGKAVPKAPPRRKGILDKVEAAEQQDAKRLAANAKRRAAYQRRKQMKKAKDEQEAAIKFSRLPANASATSDFPILQALEKQRALPVKLTAAKKSKGKGKSVAKKVEDIPSSPPLSPEILDALSLFEAPEQPMTSNASAKSSMGKLEGYRNGSTKKPQDIQPLTPNGQEEISLSQPSTITHVPSSALREIDRAGGSSSSAVPYSSPLARQSAQSPRLVHPRPLKTGGAQDVGNLESWVEDEGSPPRNAIPHPIQLQTPQQSSTRVEASSSRHSKISDILNRKRRASSSPVAMDGEGEWTTRPDKRGKSSYPKAMKGKQTLAKFKKPVVPFPNVQPRLPPSKKETSPPASVTRTKLTLFCPQPTPQAKLESDDIFTIQTNKGSRYGSAASTKAGYDEEIQYIDVKQSNGRNARSANTGGRYPLDQDLSYPTNPPHNTRVDDRAHATASSSTDQRYGNSNNDIQHSHSQHDDYQIDQSHYDDSHNHTHYGSHHDRNPDPSRSQYGGSSSIDRLPRLHHQPMFDHPSQPRPETRDKDWTDAWRRSRQPLRRKSTWAEQ